MVGEDERDFDGQLARTPAPKEIGQTMVQLGNHQHDAHFLLRLADRPFAFQIRRQRGERLVQGRAVEREALRINRHSGKEPFAERIGELVDLQQIAAVIGDKTGEPCEQADPVGTRDF